MLIRFSPPVHAPLIEPQVEMKPYLSGFFAPEVEEYARWILAGAGAANGGGVDDQRLQPDGSSFAISEASRGGAGRKRDALCRL